MTEDDLFKRFRSKEWRRLRPTPGEDTMYEIFTDRARKVLQLANQEAHCFNHEYVGTEHILLGLIKEGYGVAANVLKNLDFDLRKARAEVERVVKPGTDAVSMGKLPLTPAAKKVIEYSIEEARALVHNYIGTEHLLLGLIREEGEVASEILKDCGLTPEIVRQEILDLLGHPNSGETPVGRKRADVLYDKIKDIIAKGEANHAEAIVQIKRLFLV